MTVLIGSAIHINSASLFASDGYYFSIDTSNTASVYGRYNQDQAVVIPGEFSNHYITEIANNAFDGDEYIVSLDLTNADMLESIGNYAFYNCNNLTGTVLISGRVNSLGLSAFQGCSSLNSVMIISNNVKLIPEQCFYNCVLLNDVILPAGLKRIDKYAFANCKLKEISIPESVEYIDATSFAGNDDIVFHCYADSYAHSFAEDNGIEYVLIDDPVTPDPTEPVTEATEATTTTEPETVATEATEPPTTAPVSYIMGDVDNSGNVDVVDATFAQRYTIHASIPDEILDGIVMRADVDNTGELDSADVTFIMRHLIRVKTPYPIGETVSRFI